MANLGTLRTLEGLLSRFQIGGAAGKSFKGDRDLYETLGYDKELDADKFRIRFRRGSVAQRVVTAYPDATWRGGAELIDDEDVEEYTPFEQAFKDLDKRLGVWSKFRRLDILAGLGEYAIMVIGAPGVPETPLPKKVAFDKIAYLSLYNQDEAQIVEVMKKTDDPRFGLPLFYDIKRKATRGSAKSGLELPLKRVHHSRVLHVADGIIDDPTYGTPRLECVWNDLDDLDKVVGGGAEAFWARVHQGYHLNVNAELDLDEPEEEKLKEQILLLQHKLSRTLVTRGIELDVLGSDVAQFSPQATTILTKISAGTGIPLRILTGSERGELASTQDSTNYDERVVDRRHEWAEPVIVRPFVELLIAVGALPTPTHEDGWRVQWPELKKSTDLEKSAIATAWAGLNTAAGDIVVTAAEVRDKVLGLEPLTEEQLAAEEEKAAAKAEQDMAMMEKEGEIKAKNAPPLKPGQKAVPPGGKPLPSAPPGLRVPPKAAAAAELTTLSSDPDFRRVHAAADQHEARIVRQIERAITRALDVFPEDALTEAIRSGERGRIDGLLGPLVARLGDTFTHVEAVLLDCVSDSGTSAATAANRRGTLRSAEAPGQRRDRTGKWTAGGSFETLRLSHTYVRVDDRLLLESNLKNPNYLEEGSSKAVEVTVDLLPEGVALINRIDAVRQGKGYGRETLEGLKTELPKLGVTKMSAYVEHTNFDSQNMLQKLGFDRKSDEKSGSRWELTLPGSGN